MTTSPVMRPVRRRAKRLLAAGLVGLALLIYPVRKMFQYHGGSGRTQRLPAGRSGFRAGRRHDDSRAECGTLRWSGQRGGTINDASCLNRTPIQGMVGRSARSTTSATRCNTPRANGLKVVTAGVKHSMGGQAFAAAAAEGKKTMAAVTHEVVTGEFAARLVASAQPSPESGG